MVMNLFVVKQSLEIFTNILVVFNFGNGGKGGSAIPLTKRCKQIKLFFYILYFEREEEICAWIFNVCYSLETAAAARKI